MVIYNPKDPIIRNILDRLIHDRGTIVDSNKAQNFSKHAKIKYLRKKDKIYIAKDHRKNKSIILLDGITLRKDNGRYFFDGL